MKELIKDNLEEHIRVLETFAESQRETIENISKVMLKALKTGKKCLIFGNGGSAADAQHFAAELVVRFKFNRPAIPAIALTTDTSVLTSIGNDFSYDEIFSRQIEALAQEGDVCIGISTSGSSSNVVKGLEEARNKKTVTIGLTGQRGGTIKNLCDVCLMVPAETTDRIQECHEVAVHILADLIEKEIFQANP